MQAFYDSTAFVMSWEGREGGVMGRALIHRALIHIGDPKSNVFLNMA
jgi:hypothetical protein